MILRSVLLGLTLIGAAHADNVTVPADDMGWVVERKPFETPTKVLAVIHDPNLSDTINATSVQIERPRYSASAPYEVRLIQKERDSLVGEAKLFVDGQQFASVTLDPRNSTIQFQSSEAVAAMETGSELTIALPNDDTLTLPLDGFAAAWSPEDANVNPNAIMRHTSIGNQCVQREGAFNYYCTCLADEFVKSFPAEVPPGTNPQKDAFSNAETVCRANLENKILADLSIQEAMLGAKLSAAGDEAPTGAVLVGDLIPGGSAQSAGVRTGDLIVKVGSAPAENQLLQPKPMRAGARNFDVYSPTTDETRTIRIGLTTPPADATLKTYPQYPLASAEPAQQTTEPSAEPKPEPIVTPTPDPVPEPAPVAYNDPLGEACGRDNRLNDLYDCACIDAKAPSIREELADKQLETQKPYIPRREAGVKQAQDRLAKATTDAQITSAQNQLERAEQSLNEATTRPDPASIPVSSVALYAYKGSSCKKPDYVFESELKACSAAASRMQGVTDPEAFCQCSAEKTAAKWMQSEDAYGSSLAVSMASSSRTECRG